MGYTEDPLFDYSLFGFSKSSTKICPSFTFQCEDRESAPVTRLPIVRDPTFIPRIHRELGPGSARRWEHAGLQSAAQFAWAMTVAAARANGGTAAGTALPAEAVAAVIDDDEAAVDAALDNRSE